MNIGSCSEAVVAYVGPGKIRFDSARAFCNKGDRARRSTGCCFVVAWGQPCERRYFDSVVNKFFVSRSVRFKFRKRSFLLAELKTSIPGFVAHKAQYFFHQGAGLGRAVRSEERSV